MMAILNLESAALLLPFLLSVQLPTTIPTKNISAWKKPMDFFREYQMDKIFVLGLVFDLEYGLNKQKEDEKPIKWSLHRNWLAL